MADSPEHLAQRLANLAACVSGSVARREAAREFSSTSELLFAEHERQEALRLLDEAEAQIRLLREALGERMKAEG